MDAVVVAAAGENAVRATFSDSIVLRPRILTDEPETGRASIQRNTGPGERSVSGADVANFVAFCAARAGQMAITLEIFGGNRPICYVLKQTVVSVF